MDHPGEEIYKNGVIFCERGELVSVQHWLEHAIRSFVECDRGNRLPGSCRPIFGAPLVGYADAQDPIFARLQEEGVVGPHHRTPVDWLPEAATVVSYFLPIDPDINRRNYPVDYCSERWLYARFYGELFNERLRRKIAARLRAEGYEACSPPLMDEFASRELSSNWSERHVAYAAGLGSFGLHAGLITDKGVSGRFGSVITELQMQPTPGERTDRTENCLWFSGGECRTCADRCPVGALHPDGKDKAACRAHLRGRGRSVQQEYGFPYFACGKCYVDVPCERTVPQG